MDQELFLKALAFLTATTMLLATYVLAALRCRLGGLLDAWQSEPVAVLPTTTSK
jgi:hypothetical protein